LEKPSTQQTYEQKASKKEQGLTKLLIVFIFIFVWVTFGWICCSYYIYIVNQRASPQRGGKKHNTSMGQKERHKAIYV